MTYGVGRFVIEFFRGDPDRGFVLGGVLSTSQAIAVGMVLVGLAIRVDVDGLQARRCGNPLTRPGRTS